MPPYSAQSNPLEAKDAEKEEKELVTHEAAVSFTMIVMRKDDRNLDACLQLFGQALALCANAPPG